MHLRTVDRVLEDPQPGEDRSLGLILLIPRRQTVLVAFFVDVFRDWPAVPGRLDSRSGLPGAAR
ncbi:hypothetical protein [Streptomyces sp. NPDC000618]|uniref:hypothetical protein n=1 Tax=Streptomyces sp. NPDC000618 TaxID=3154265 RepID=UPI0033335715